MSCNFRKFYLTNLNEVIAYIKENDFSYDEVYSILASFGIDQNINGADITSYKDAVCNYAVSSL